MKLTENLYLILGALILITHSLGVYFSFKYNVWLGIAYTQLLVTYLGRIISENKKAAD